MNWLESKPFTTLFVDGNHENFDRLYAYPVEEWKGGKIHRIRPSVIHLMHGQVFTFEENKILNQKFNDFKKKTCYNKYLGKIVFGMEEIFTGGASVWNQCICQFSKRKQESRLRNCS